MTQEEAKKFGLNILHGVLARNEKFDPSYANLVKEAIDVLSQPSLPSNLDEAAEDSWAVYEYRESPKGLYSTCYVDGYVDGFQAGAEWMAGQGETIDGEILTTSDYGWETIRIPKKLYPLGTKVTIQIRKKNDL